MTYLALVRVHSETKKREGEEERLNEMAKSPRRSRNKNPEGPGTERISKEIDEDTSS